MENNIQSEIPVIESLTPTGYRVLVNIYKKPTATASGLELPETENAGMPVKGQIVSLGKKTLFQKLAVFFGFKARYKIGSWVYFRKYSVDVIVVNTPSGDLTLYILEEDEVVGLMN